MLIDGQAAEKTQAEMLNQLSSLKSSFSEYLSAKPPYIPPPDVSRLYNEGQQFLSKGQTQQALQQFQTAEQMIPKDQPNNQFLASVYSNIAVTQHALGKHQEAAVNFQKSAAEFMENKDYYNAEVAYKNLATTHQANGTLEKYEKENQTSLENSLKNNDQSQELSARLALGGVNRAQGKHKEALEHYAVGYDLQQGKVDYTADRVEQHEVGFSDKKIGTDNIQQCVAVILHDPVTKKTALAHVDRYTDTTSLANVVANFPEGTKLDAYLVGGRDRSPQSKAVSDDNIARVTGELSKHAAVNIKSADIGDKGAPSGIVFDPQTAKLEHAVPGKHHETTDARKLLHNLTPPLNFAFDLTKSPEMKAPVFSDLDKESLVQRYLNTPKTAGNATETWNANIIYDPLAKTVEKIRQSNPKIVEAVVEKNLDYKLNQGLSEQKININEQQRQEIKSNLLSNVKESLQDPNKPFSKIEQELEKNIKENTSKLAKSVEVQQEQSTWGKIKNAVAKTWETIKEVASNVVGAIKNTWKTITGGKTAQSQQPEKDSSQQTVASQQKEIKAPQLNQAKQKELDKPTYSPETIKKVEQFRNQSPSKSHSNTPPSTPQNRQQNQNKDQSFGK